MSARPPAPIIPEGLSDTRRRVLLTAWRLAKPPAPLALMQIATAANMPHSTVGDAVNWLDANKLWLWERIVPGEKNEAALRAAAARRRAARVALLERVKEAAAKITATGEVPTAPAIAPLVDRHHRTVQSAIRELVARGDWPFERAPQADLTANRGEGAGPDYTPTLDEISFAMGAIRRANYPHTDALERAQQERREALWMESVRQRRAWRAQNRTA